MRYSDGCFGGGASRGCWVRLLGAMVIEAWGVVLYLMPMEQYLFFLPLHFNVLLFVLIVFALGNAF